MFISLAEVAKAQYFVLTVGQVFLDSYHPEPI